MNGNEMYYAITGERATVRSKEIMAVLWDAENRGIIRERAPDRWEYWNEEGEEEGE